MDNIEALRYRIAPLEMTESEFRKVGHQVIERIAKWLCSLPNRPVAPNEMPGVLREAFGTGSLPEQGAEARDLLAELVTGLQRSGEAFLSNAVVGGTFLLRACIVNFRTVLEDIEALPGIIIRIGREVDATIRPGALKQKERTIR